MLRQFLLAASVLTFASAVEGQGCAGTGQTFFKNDNLVDVPSAATPVALIQGLCEGEACGAVFDVGGPAEVDSVAVMLAQAAGANGSLSVVDVEIFDGVSESGGVYSMGTRVFSLQDDLGANLQLTSHAINTYDLPTPVATTQAKIAIVFTMLLNNANGNCTSGYTTNFATDNSPCLPSTHGKNILKTIASPGGPPPDYYDPQQLTILGFPLCAFNFYTGNWIIRACIRPDIQMTWSGDPQPGNFLILDIKDPQNPGKPWILMMGSTIATGWDMTPFWPNVKPVALDLNPIHNCFWGPCRAMFLAGGMGVLNAQGEAQEIMQIPTGTFWSGMTLHGQFFTYEDTPVPDIFNWLSISPPSAPIPIL